jgi:methyl-accepting chemotaxis protein
MAEKAGLLLTKIVPDIQKSADLMQEIAAASREQSVGTDQINKAMIQLDTVIQQNASSSEELAASSEELTGQAIELQRVASFFITGREAGASAAKKPGERKAAPRASVGGKIAIKSAPVRTTAIAIAKDDKDDEFETF